MAKKKWKSPPVAGGATIADLAKAIDAMKASGQAVPYAQHINQVIANNLGAPYSPSYGGAVINGPGVVSLNGVAYVNGVPQLQSAGRAAPNGECELPKNKAVNVVPVNLEQASRITVICATAGIPVCLWGPPGIGKSTMPKDLAAQLGATYLQYRLTYMEAQDFGYPMPDGDWVKILMPHTFPVEGNDRFEPDSRYLINWDEINRASPDVLNMMTEVLLDRSLNGRKLLPGCIQVATGNIGDVGCTPLSEAVIARMCHLYIETHSKEALQSYKGWAANNGIHPSVVGFAEFRQEVWAGKAQEPEEIAFANSRSFDCAGKLLYASMDVSFDIGDIMLPMMAGCVGKAPATEFLAFHQTHGKMPTLDEVTANPNTCKVPTEPDVLYAFGQRLVRACKDIGNGQGFIETVAVYGQRWPDEPAAHLYRQICEAVQSANALPSYQAWRKKIYGDESKPRKGRAKPGDGAYASAADLPDMPWHAANLATQAVTDMIARSPSWLDPDEAERREKLMQEMVRRAEAMAPNIAGSSEFGGLSREQRGIMSPPRQQR